MDFRSALKSLFARTNKYDTFCSSFPLSWKTESGLEVLEREWNEKLRGLNRNAKISHPVLHRNYVKPALTGLGLVYPVESYAEGNLSLKGKPNQPLPWAADMCARMVICVFHPECEGGDVIIRDSHNNICVVLDKKKDTETDEFSIHFAAYLPGCTCEIRPVEAGVCGVVHIWSKYLVPQYDLRINPLADSLESLANLYNGELVFLPLMNKYEAQPPINKLTGLDAVIAQQLLSFQRKNRLGYTLLIAKYSRTYLFDNVFKIEGAVKYSNFEAFRCLYDSFITKWFLAVIPNSELHQAVRIRGPSQALERLRELHRHSPHDTVGAERIISACEHIWLDETTLYEFPNAVRLFQSVNLTLHMLKTVACIGYRGSRVVLKEEILLLEPWNNAEVGNLFVEFSTHKNGPLWMDWTILDELYTSEATSAKYEFLHNLARDCLASCCCRTTIEKYHAALLIAEHLGKEHIENFLNSGEGCNGQDDLSTFQNILSNNTLSRNTCKIIESHLLKEIMKLVHLNPKTLRFLWDAASRIPGGDMVISWSVDSLNAMDTSKQTELLLACGNPVPTHPKMARLINDLLSTVHTCDESCRFPIAKVFNFWITADISVADVETFLKGSDISMEITGFPSVQSAETFQLLGEGFGVEYSVRGTTVTLNKEHGKFLKERLSSLQSTVSGVKRVGREPLPDSKIRKLNL